MNLISSQARRSIVKKGTSNNYQQATKIQFRWLIFLILSFAYDIPLYDLTPFERVNPRLVDVATLLGIIFVLPKLSKVHLPQIFKIWKVLVFWFVFCSLIWSVFWLPWQGVGMFSAFYAVRYLQGLLLLYMALSIPISERQKEILMYIVIAGGVFVAIYAIPEYIRGDTMRLLAGGKVIYHAEGALFSSLGTSYHHLAGFSSLAFGVALSSLLIIKSKKHRIIMLVLAIFIAWPALASGARSGLLAVGIIFILAIFYLKTIRSYLILAFLLSLPFLILVSTQMPSLSDLESKSRSIERLINMGEIKQENDISERFGIGNYSLDLYEWQGSRIVILGGGFYVVPHSIGGSLRYRIGYGIHNSYLFPLEQGGVIAFFLFILLLIYIYKSLKRMKKSPIKVDKAFAVGIWMFFITQIISGFFGGNAIWQSVGMENFSTYVLLMYMIASKNTFSTSEEVKEFR